MGLSRTITEEHGPVVRQAGGFSASASEPVDKPACSICGCARGKRHIAREMMFGILDLFVYFECEACGCLSLVSDIEDWKKYYSEGYYSFRIGASSRLRKLRNRVYLSRLAFLVNWHGRSDFDCLRRAGLTRQKRLLDVGCGGGFLLRDLRELGYCAEGADPCIPCDIHDAYGIRVHRSRLEDLNGQWDVILFRHSLEHMRAHVRTLSLAKERLRDRGVCVVCIPLAGWAWQHYGVNWAQLDAPRHVLIHTLASFGQLTSEAGFLIDKVIFDSDDFQFWASEAYSRGTPLVKCPRPGIWRTHYLRRRAEWLNRHGAGDKAQFYLRPA